MAHDAHGSNEALLDTSQDFLEPYTHDEGLFGERLEFRDQIEDGARDAAELEAEMNALRGAVNAGVATLRGGMDSRVDYRESLNAAADDAAFAAELTATHDILRDAKKVVDKFERAEHLLDDPAMREAWRSNLRMVVFARGQS